MSRISYMAGLLLLVHGPGCAPPEPDPHGGTPCLNQGELCIEGNVLINPEVSPSAVVTSNIPLGIMHPNESMYMSLDYIASDVLGIGLSFSKPGEDHVVHILSKPGFGDITSGTIDGSLGIGDICEMANVGAVCTELESTQYVIIDKGSSLLISQGVAVPVVAVCGECGSASCVELLRDRCQACPQPSSCAAFAEQCLDGDPPATASAKADFESLFGPFGMQWSTDQGCEEGAALCEEGVGLATSLDVDPSCVP